ncbi:hypothetical protein BB560_007310 [Smittium megazygosporum]|uniref:Uncharacterized protein n=1 Tax=Smittium megazygosporum TaxID=133381 RepID=A0A2T9XWW7_9FUNG|nr:hypothetical protein BB560_007310 [Smittium megazygosporum]
MAKCLDNCVPGSKPSETALVDLFALNENIATEYPYIVFCFGAGIANTTCGNSFISYDNSTGNATVTVMAGKMSKAHHNKKLKIASGFDIQSSSLPFTNRGLAISL